MRGSKKNLASNLSRAERRALLERDHPDLSLKTQCNLLSLNRTSLYYQPVPPSPAELYLKRRIDKIYTDCPCFAQMEVRRNGEELTETLGLFAHD